MTLDAQVELYARRATLFGNEGIDWEYPETGKKWWWIKLWLRRN